MRMLKNQKTLKTAMGMLLSVVLLTGCSSEGENGQLPVFPVSGKIMVDGKNPKDAVVMLYNLENNKVAKEPILPRPKAVVREDGSFAISTYRTGDGAPEGEYVMVVTWKGDLKEYDQDDDEEVIDRLPELVPKEYTLPVKSKLRVTVKKDEENVIPEITIDS